MFTRLLRQVHALALPRYAMVLMATLLLGGGLVGVNVLTASADPRMPVSIEPQVASVQSGEFLTYNAFVGCSIPEGCANATFTFSKPPGASGPGVVAQPYPPGVSSVTQLPNGDVKVVFASIAVGTTKQLVVSWPTVNAYTVPGPQPVTMTGTSDGATTPSTADTTMQVTAAPNLTMNKGGPANIAVDTNFQYGINVYNNGSSARGLLAIDNATVTDVLPPGLEFVSTNAGGTYDPATRTITWHLDSNSTIPGDQFAGATNLVVTVRAPSNANPPLQGTTIKNTAFFSGEPHGGGEEITAEASASTAIAQGVGAAVPTFDKIAASSVGDGQNLGYFLSVKNDGTAAGSATVTDTLPLGFDLQSVNYAIVGTPMDFVYSDGSTATIVYTGGIVNVAKAGVRVTKITLHVPSINPLTTIQHTLVGKANLADLPAGSTMLQNCATAVMGGITRNDCTNTTITAPQVSFGIMKSTNQEPVNPGGTHTWKVDLDNKGAPMAPQVIDLLPPELEYVPGSFAFTAMQSGPCPATTDFTVTNPANWNDGRDAVIITGKPGILLPTGALCDYTFQTRVKPGAPSGTYTQSGQTNRIYLFDQLGQPFPNGNPDPSDINHDGITGKSQASYSDAFAIAESSAAEIVKQVKGDQDDEWLDSAEVPGQEDQIGTSDWGGTVDWRLKMGNQGNRNLTDLVAYDLLPDPASPGITDGRYDETKPYEWVPTMTGPIDAGSAPVTITYSTKTDPCRPEMDATRGSASFWCNGQVDSSFKPAADVTDWSKIKSVRFDFGDHVFPGGEYFTFDWKMDVPTVDPDGVKLENGAETWNKSAVQAARRNGDGSTLPLLPAEAPWVVDVIRITPIPLIEIVKKDVAGNDANTADDAVEVPAGADTPLVFTIHNNGTEPLVDVNVTDAVTDGGASVTGLTCDFSDLGGPATGTTWAGPFQPDDEFPCTATLSALDPGDPHADVAKVTATGEESGTDVDDDDPYHATTTAEPGVTIVKEDAAGNDANSAASPVLAPAGEPTDLVFTITNDGTETLDDVEVTDAVTDGAATVTGLTCDFSDLGGPATGTTWDGPFKVGDSFECTATLSALTPGDPHADLASVSGTGHFTGTKVDDDDPYHAETPIPDVKIVKQDAAGNDADTADDAVDVVPGVETELEFTITNNGTEPLVDVEVTDAVTEGDATVTDLTCDFSDLGGPATGTTWDGPFGVSESFECTATLSALTPGIDHADVAKVTGTGQHSGTDVDDDNPYHAQTTPKPGVTIVKQDADGNDADTADDAVTVPKGASTDLVFTITNSGIEPLEDVKVTDEITASSGTISGLSCDFSDLGGPATGTTWDGPFKVGDSFECHATLSGLVPGELHTDVATVEGTGQYSGTPVDDDNPWNGKTPPIYAIGDFMWFDLDKDGIQDGTEPAVQGAKVTLTDANGDPVLDADGNEVAPTTTDVNGKYHFDNLPAGSYIVTFTAPTGYEFTTVLTGSDPKVDSDAVPATGASAVVDLGEDDPNLTASNDHDGVVAPKIDRTIDAGVVVSGTPDIDIEKADAAGNDADTVAETVVVPKDTATDLVFTITNNGTEPLVDVKVADEVTDGDATVTGLSCDFSGLGGPATGTTWDGPFKVGDSFGCTADLSALTPGIDHADLATVDAAGQYSGTPVDDDDPYHASTTPQPNVTIEKADAAGNDADDEADAVTVTKGDTTDLVFTVRNTGSEPLDDVKVTDEVTAGSGTISGLTCDFSALGGPATGTTWDGPFKVGDEFTCSATLSALTPGELHTDVATVDGTGHYSGTPVDDDDPWNGKTPPIYAIGDFMWFDLNKDGIQDGTEPAVQGAKVTLTDANGDPVLDADGNEVAPTTTDVNGKYHFDNLPAGNYVVTFTAPTGYEFTTVLSGTDPKVDSDANVTTGSSAVIALGDDDPNLTDSNERDGVVAPHIDRTIDAGVIVSGSPGVTIEKGDADGNEADTVEDAVTVPNETATDLVFTITNSGTEPLKDIEVTDEVTEGEATVTGLSCDFSDLGGPASGTTWDGPFKVGASFECTAVLSKLEPGSSHADVATVNGAGQYSGTPVDDDNPYHADTPPLVSVGDYVWFDTNRNGVQDEGEAPVEGVTVNIYDADGKLVDTTTTDEHGFYSFTDLRAATEYQIEFIAPKGSSFTTGDAGDDDAVDSDANVETGQTRVFTTPATGSNSATTPDDPTWDAGLVQLDLTITKTLVSDGLFQAGDTVEFQLVPHNNGPVDALTGWSVTDVMPEGLTLVSLAGEGYECTLSTATCVDVTGERLAADADGGPITVTATIDTGVTGVLHNVTYVAPVDGDVPETNPLDVPDTDTDTSKTDTNNDDQADLTVDEVPVTTTTTEPPAVVNETTVPQNHGNGNGNGNGRSSTSTGTIARTGADVARQVGLGGGLAVAGLVLVLAARRRRRGELA
jgi:uncharacterized repeat protein (TIGR01451 family)